MTGDEIESASLEHRLKMLQAMRATIEWYLSEGGDQELASKLSKPFAQTASKFAADICGPDILRMAQGADNEIDDPLYHIGQRLLIAFPLMRSPTDSHSDQLLLEVAAVTSGDPPQLFATRLRNTIKKYRLARMQLEALKWEKFLAGQGEAPFSRQAQIQIAYHLTWEAIRKWRDDCCTLLGQDYVATALIEARMIGEGRAKNDSGWWLDEGKLQHISLQDAAKAYWAEKRTADE
jgi:hypothetical protein